MLGFPSNPGSVAMVIKRSDFGLGAYVPAVSDEVNVRITTEAAVAK